MMHERKADLNILMLNYEFPPLGGGAANATQRLLEEYGNQKSLKIDLITSSITAEDRIEKFRDNIAIHYLNIGKKGGLHYQTNANLLSYLQRAYGYSLRMCRENSYHLIHAFFSVPCGLIAWRLGIPYIVSLRGSDVPFYSARFFWLDLLILRHLNKKIWQKAAFVVANSNGLRGLALKTSPDENIQVIPNGVDVNLFNLIPGAIKENVVLTVGRLIKRKGIDQLIRAFSLLDGSLREKYKIRIIGEGPEKEHLTSLARRLNIQDRVEFSGVVQGKALIDAYNRAKIFALTSFNEGMSNTVLEAMACGLPVLGTDIRGINDIIQNGEEGFLVPPRDPRKTSLALEKLLSNDSLRQSMGERGREKTRGFRWCDTAKNYADIYDKTATF